MSARAPDVVRVEHRWFLPVLSNGTDPQVEVRCVVAEGYGGSGYTITTPGGGQLTLSHAQWGVLRDFMQEGDGS